MTRFLSIGFLLIVMLTGFLPAQEKSTASQQLVFAVMRTTSPVFEFQSFKAGYTNHPTEVKMTISLDGEIPLTHDPKKSAGLRAAPVKKINADDHERSVRRGKALITLTD